MLLITTQTGILAVIRPTPLVSITCTPIKNKVGIFGASYDIVLTGTILADEGSPFSTGNHHATYNKPNGEAVSYFGIGPNTGDLPRLESILTKQNALRELFALEGSRFELAPVNTPPIVFYPKLVSIAFEEGVYTDICRYTVNLKADSILNDSDEVYKDSSYAPNGYNAGNKTEIELIAEFGGLVEDFSETWSVEVDEGVGETVGAFGPHNPRTYRLTRNLNAIGRDGFIPSGNGVGRLYGWKEARNFLQKSVIENDLNGGFAKYPNYTYLQSFSDYAISLTGTYVAANHTRTENIDKTAGSFSITDTWLLTSGVAYENYNLSLNASIDNPFISVSINGTIKGLSVIPSSGTLYGGLVPSTGIPSPFDNAKFKYFEVSNNGTYGITSYIYKRACNAANTTLNSQPKSIALATNEFAGEITYNVEFDNRPTNFISGVLSESINVNDTYPGDVFAIIPVLGRSTGPVLQYIGGRTEYRRDVGIEILLDYTDIPYSSGRNPLLLAKPSLREPIRSQLNTLIKQLSPAYEPGVRKYFLNPPSESWTPKEGRYSINLSWTYELDH
jgi:hypothetical protein